MITSGFKLWLWKQRIALGIAFLLLAGTGLVKWQAGLMPEDTAVPAPPMPSPNARDTFTAAEAMLRGLYYEAGNNHLSLAEKNKIVAENLPAIAKLHQGFAYAYGTPPMRSFQKFTSYGVYDRSMAQLLSLTGRMRALHGDWGGAMESDLDAVEMGCDIQYGAPAVRMEIGEECEAFGRGPAYAAIDHLSAAQADAAARRLARIEANEATPAQTLQEEEWFEQGARLDMFREPTWRTELIIYRKAYDGTLPSRLVRLRLKMESPRTDYDNYSRYMNAVLPIARLPWPQARLAKLPQAPSDPVNSNLLPIVYEVDAIQDGNLTLDRLLEVQLALRAYKADHGRYPAELADLVPAYLPAVPLDPFSDSQPLHYRLERSKYLLYSIGPDAVDNGGKPVVDPTFPKDHGYFSDNLEASGDIVAGVNY